MDDMCVCNAMCLAPEPVVCAERGGPTPTHPEPGRETSQRRRYWRRIRWESRSAHHTKGKMQNAKALSTLCILHSAFCILSRHGAVAARRAHNPKVGGSNPPAATKIDTTRHDVDDVVLFVSYPAVRA